jgi:hypothetical protein
VQYAQIVIAADDCLRPGGKRQFEVLIVFGVAAIAHRNCRLKPDCRGAQDFQKLYAAR